MSELKYCLSIPGGNTLEFSSGQLGEFLTQIESELYLSQVYGRAISSLHDIPGDINKGMQALLGLVAREAIRLTLRRFVQREMVTTHSVSHSVPVSSNDSATSAVLPVSTTPSPRAAMLEEKRLEEKRQEPKPPSSSRPASQATAQPGINPATVVSRPVERLSSQRLSQQSAKLAQPVRKPTKAELAAQAALKTWQQQVQNVGAELKQARLDQALSPYHLYLRTMVPLYQIEALETGQVDRLPEDVYVRGFIRQLGDALGLDGLALVNSLPNRYPPKTSTLAPSWHKPKVKSTGLNIHPAHLYLGYTAAVAGGFFWLSQHMTPKAPEPLVLDSDNAAETPSETAQHSVAAQQNLVQKRATIGHDVAPPETVPDR